MTSKTVTVESTQEYRDAIDAADTLGLEVKKIKPSRNGWESPDYDAVTPHPHSEVVKVGRKYVHFDFETADDLTRAAFGEDYFGDKAHLRLELI